MPQLRDYQLEDVTYLLTKDAMGLFNEQRTGKTPTALMVMQAREVEHLLIVCPATLLYNWYNECKRWLGISDICVIESAKNLKIEEEQRTKLNAKNLVEKRMQKSKLKRELDECLYLNSKVEYEAIKAFQDYMNKLEEMHIKTLIEQGILSSDFEM